MAHETHTEGAEKKSVISFRSSFWLVIILALLFIAALNFINVMGKSEGEGKEKTEATTETAPAVQKGEVHSTEGNHNNTVPQDSTHKEK